MKKIIFLTAYFMFTVATGIFAKVELPKRSWDLGTEISHIVYKEPDVMEEKGWMYGLAGSYTFREKFVFKTDGRAAFGQVDYSSPSSGSMDNLDDFIIEVRQVGGYDFCFSDNLVIMPYFGFGYRYLNDDSSGMATSTGALGYERESNYFYSPIGVEAVGGLQDGWVSGVALEYDYFWKGVQISHLSGANSSFADLENDQNKGYGLRASLKLKRKSEKIDFVVEPFIRYWKIKRSEEEPVSFSGVIIGTGYEPENNSTEFGIKLAVKF
ncbi:MAG: hypothetical protein AABY43_02835 [Candidatus Omnitrophota bacterium]